MEETTCNLCGADNAELVYVEKDRLMKLPGSFRLVRCRQCGLFYLNPRPTPEEMGSYYPQEYIPYAVAQEHGRTRMHYLNRSYGNQKRARAIGALRPQGGKLLDVGCASGEFLHIMGQVGIWEVEGLDISRDATQVARERYGLRVFIGELETAAYPTAFFDVVTLWDVIEHLHDPKGTLDEVQRILKPGGLLVMSTPNLQSWDARLFGPYWAGLDAPRHLFVFSPVTVSTLLGKAGFRIESIRSLSTAYSPFARSTQFWLEDRLHSEKTRGPLLTLVGSRGARALTWPFFFLLQLLNKTFAMTVFAVKKAAGASEWPH
jgi:SAM-dependent methyltransferase